MAGKFLDELMESIEVDRKMVFITSVIKCFPLKNRPPKSDELKACRPYLEQQINITKPRIIIALGNYAVHSLLDEKSNITQLHVNRKLKMESKSFQYFILLRI